MVAKVHPSAQESSTFPLRLLLPNSPSPGLLPIHLLHISTSYNRPQYPCLGHFFNPVTFKLSSSTVQAAANTRVDFGSWTRLRELIFEDAFLYDGLLQSGRTESTCDGQLKVSYDISSLEPEGDALYWISADLDTEGERFRVPGSVVGEVVVRVCTEEQKEFLLEDLEGSLILPRLTIIVKGYVALRLVAFFFLPLIQVQS